MASVREILVRVTGDSSDAERSLNRVAAKILETGKSKARPEVDIAGVRQAAAKIEAMRGELTTLGAMKVKPEVQVQVDRGLARLALLDRELAAFQNKIQRRNKGGGGFGSDFLRSLEGQKDLAQLLSRIGIETGNVGRSVAGASGPVNNLNGAFSGMLGFVKQLNPVIQGLSLVLLVALVPAIGAVAAGIGAAITSVLGMANAFLFSLGPVILFMVALFQRFMAVMQAREARQAAINAATRKSATSEREAAAAAERHHDAQVALRNAEESRSNAVRQLAQASVDAYRAMEDAAERATDAVLGLEDAQLGVDESKLALREARLELSKFAKQAGLSEDAFEKFTDVEFDRKGLAKLLGGAGQGQSEEDQLKLEQLLARVRRAKLNVAQATDRVSDAEREQKRATEDNAKFLKSGVGAYDGLRSAKDALRDANQRVTEAEHNLKNSMRDTGDAADAATGPMAIYNRLVGKLSDGEKQLLDLSIKLPKALRKLSAAGTDAFIAGLVSSLGRLKGLAGGLSFVFGALGTSWAKNMEDFAKDLTGSAWRRGFIVLSTEALYLSHVLGGPVWRRFWALMRDLALAAIPSLNKMVDAMSRKFGAWGRAVGGTNLGKTTTLFNRMGDVLRSMLGAIGGLASGFFGFMKDALPYAQDFFDWIAGIGRKIADWANSTEGQEAIKSFFEDTMPMVKSVLSFVGKLVILFLQLIQFLAPAFKFVIDTFNPLLDVLIFIFRWLNKIPASVRSLLGLFFPFTGIIGRIGRIAGRVFGFFFGIGGRMLGPVSRFTGALGVIPQFLRNMLGPVGRLAGGLVERIVGAFRGVGRRIRQFIIPIVTSFHAIINGVVAAVNMLITAFNRVTPGALKFHGHTIVPGIPDIPTIPALAFGGLATSSTLAQIGEAGKEAVLPMRGAVLRNVATAIVSAMPRSIGVPGVGGGRGGDIIHQEFHVSAPAGEVPDARYAAAQLAQLMRKRGKGLVTTPAI